MKKHWFVSCGRSTVALLFILVWLSLACTLEPGVSITAPGEGTTVEAGASVLFQVSVKAAAGHISEVVWVSSIDGELDRRVLDTPATTASSSFTRSDLSPGLHAFYCYAYSDAGLIGMDHTSVTVGAATGTEELYVLIASPRNGQVFHEGDAIQLCGAAFDPPAGPLGGEALVWETGSGLQLGTGEDMITATFPIGDHTIALTALGSQGEQRTETVQISVLPGDNATDTTTAPATTTSTAGSGSSTTSVAEPGASTTTTTSAGSSTTTSTSAADTTTSTVSDLCPPEEPLLCVDADYSADQYWCCEAGTTCGKVDYDENGDPKGTCVSDGNGSSTSTAVSSTTTTAVPTEALLYLSPDPDSDLLFYLQRDDGSIVYYKGTLSGETMQLSLVSFENGSAVIFNDDFLPVQWIADGVTAAVYLVDDGESFDPHAAYHEAAIDDELEAFTVDIHPTDLRGILTQMTEQVGTTFTEAEAFLDATGITTFSEISARAALPGSDQPRFIAAAAGFSAAAAGLSIADALSDQQSARIAACSNPAAQTVVRAAASLLGSKFNEGFGPQPPADPDDPGVRVYLCRGQSSISLICHYMFFRATCNPNGTCEAGPCVPLCLSSMRCFTDLCRPMTLSAESAEEFKDHFFGE